MAPRDPNIVVSVQVGETQMGFMRFLPGQPVAAITVGLDGNWRIVAPGVGRAHLSLLFDGHELYVAALGPELHVFINGGPIDGRWWMLKAPAELRFGQACLRVFVETPSSPAPQAPHAGSREPEPIGGLGALPTRLDAAGQWDAQKRDDLQPIGTRTQLYDPSMVLPRPGAPARAGSSPPANRSNWPPPQNQAPFANPPIAQRPYAHVPVGQPIAAPAPQGAPGQVAPGATVATSSSERSSLNPVSSGEPPMASTMRRPIPGEQGEGASRGAGGSPVAMSPTIAVDASAWINPPNAKVTPGHGLSSPPGPADRDVGADDARPAGVPVAKRTSALIEAWRSASLVKKIIFFLLPLAFVAVLWPETPPEAPPAKARAPSTSATAARPAVPAASPSSLGVAAPSGAAAPGKLPAASATASAPLASAVPDSGLKLPGAGASANSGSPDAGGSARPPSDPVERSAIEAALGGRWQDALVLYDRLALSRPDEPAFREAARIIREDKMRTK
jgi:hypothetical protein